LKEIRSRDNPAIKRLRALASSSRARQELGLTLLDGAHLVSEALEAAWPLLELVFSEQGLAREEIARLVERCSDLPVLRLPDPLFAHISPVDAPSGLLALIELPSPPPVVPLSESVLVLDDVQDPGNLGTILRTAAAAGVRDVLLTAGCARAWSPRVLRAGMGGHFRLRIHERADVAGRLRGYPGVILATGVGTGARSLYECELRGPIAWLFGAEGGGLSAGIAALAAGAVTIPMPGKAESLNVASAVAVCLFEQVRQRLSSAGQRG
jgi:TrmH family RNA methyltransferase